MIYEISIFSLLKHMCKMQIKQNYNKNEIPFSDSNKHDMYFPFVPKLRAVSQEKGAEIRWPTKKNVKEPQRSGASEETPRRPLGNHLLCINR